MSRYKTGESIQLNAGGPQMTVQFADSGALLTATWFKGADLQTGTFNEASVKPYEAPQAPAKVTPKFKIGDRVQLATGGPEMTIEHMSGAGSAAGFVNVVWFQGVKPLKASYHQDTLVKLPDAPPDQPPAE